MINLAVITSHNGMLDSLASSGAIVGDAVIFSILTVFRIRLMQISGGFINCKA